MENLVFLDSMSFLPCSLRKLPEAFDLTASKWWYHHYFNSEENLDNVGPNPEVFFYDANETSESDMRDFLAWYGGQKNKFDVLDNKRVFETYSQDELPVLRQACRVLRREFIQIGNIECFLEANIIASSCNKVLRKRFLNPITLVSFRRRDTAAMSITVRNH